MSFLAQVTTGKRERPFFILIYGGDGVGKTTFGADAPNPIFLCAENGADQLDVARLPSPKTFKEVMAMVDELVASEIPYKTLVVDSLDWLEPLCWEEVCKENNAPNIEKVDGGYGKGYVFALKKWQGFIDQLKSLRDKMNVVLIAHSHIKPFNDPQHNAAYDRHELKLNAKAAALFREAADAVLYAAFEVFTKKEGQKVRAYGEGSRVLFTERRPSFDAKNRYGLPFTLPLAWEDFEAAAKKGEPESPEALKTRVEGLLSVTKDPKIKERVEKALAEVEEQHDWKRLAKIENQLLTMQGEAK